MSIPLEEVLSGGEKTISLGRGASAEKVSVKIPPGIESGKKLRVKGKGQPSPMGGQPGDLMLLVKVEPHSTFTREGSDLVVECEVPYSSAVMGSQIEVPTLDGKRFKVKVPTGCHAKSKLRLKGQGLPTKPGGPRGDLYAKIMVEVPKELTPEQQELVEKLAESGL